jgi:hypothetical protein
MTIRILLALLVACNKPDPDPPPAWSPNVRVNDDATDAEQREVSLAVDGRGTWYAGWMDLRNGVSALHFCAFAGSSDGATWTANELFKGPFNVCGDPVVAADRTGATLYRLAISADFQLAPTIDPVQSFIMLGRSSDSGRTWSDWREAVAPNPRGAQPPAGVNDKAWLAADGDRVVIAWTVLDRYLFGDVMAVRSTDGGATFGPRVKLGQGVGTCVTFDARGRVHVAWGHDVRHEVQHVRSLDGGATWSAPRAVAPTGPSFALPDDTALIIGCAADGTGDHVYLAWTGDLGGGSFDVWAAHSPDGGATWSAPVRVNDDRAGIRHTRSWIGVDAVSGDVVMAWIDTRSGAPRAYSSRSRDHGTTWDANELISDGGGGVAASDYNGLAVSRTGEVGYAWTDDRDPATKLDVYFAKRALRTRTP